MAAPPPACLWGCNHEANNTMLLLRCTCSYVAWLDPDFSKPIP